MSPAVFHRPTCARRGAVLAMVMVTLLVVTLLGLAFIKAVLVYQRQVQAIGQQQQCALLAEAGLQRAVVRFRRSSDYHGETWTVAAEALGAVRPGVVTIEIASADDEPATREIRVEARFPEDPIRRTTCRRTLVIHAPHAEEP